MKIVVAVSGGVDSLYALASLAEQGHEVQALHAMFLPPRLRRAGYPDMISRLQGECDTLGVRLTVHDCSAEFTNAVIRPFVESYAAGKTPNPCALCNMSMKFGLLLDKACELGAEHIATGHYARLVERNGKTALYGGVDTSKDQSYFLALVPEERLSRALFPLGSLHKNDIRRWVESRGYSVPAVQESQEICFVPDDAYRPFLMEMAEEMGISLPGPGAVQLLCGTPIARHKGLWNYTEGQRKGLGIAWSEPLYVHSKDPQSNVLVVDTKNNLLFDGLQCHSCNFLLPFDQWPQELWVRTRYRQKASPAKVEQTEHGLSIRELQPGGPYTPGQLAVVYMRDQEQAEGLRVLAGGIIQ